jgi:hypothetical protein
MTPVEQITSLYIGYFGRAPDPEGLTYWVGRYEDGFSLAEIAESFSVQPESTAKYPYLANPVLASSGLFIQQVYLNLFNRLPDPEGEAYWAEQLENGMDVGEFILNVISGAVTEPDASIIANKVDVGVDFAESAANVPGFVYDADAANAAVEVINGVDETEASVAEGKAETDAYINEGPAPTVSVLTTAIDNIAGDEGFDQINGVIAGGATGTFNTGDTINGGAGEDTLNLIVTTGTTITPASITNVETIAVQDLSGGNINLANATGVETLASNNSTATTTFNNVAALAGIEVSNTTGAGVTVNYAAAAVAGTADVQNVAVNNAAAAVNTAGIEQFNVTATGANTLGLTGGTVTTVNVAGAGSVALGALGVTTLNAAENAGGVTATLTAAGNVTATGGAGSDVFSFGTGLTATDVVNGGAGTDTVRVTTGGDLSAAAGAAPFNALTSVERVAFDGAGVILNGATFTNAGITNIEFNTTGGTADIINNAGSARTYEFGVDNADAATFNMNGTSTTLNLALLGTNGTAAANDGNDADVGALTVNLSGVAPAGTLATINIVSNGDLAETGGAAFNDVGVVTAVAGSTINISGAGNLDFAGLTNSGVINASAATGNLVIEGSNATLLDAIAPAAYVSGSDTITLGSGADVVQFGDALASGVINTTSAATTAQGLQIDVVNGFTAGANGDILDATFGASAGVDSNYTAISADAQAAINALSGATATLQNAADIAVDIAQEGGANGEWTAFNFQGQTYAVYDAAGDGADSYDAANDLLVQITGVNVANLTDANFA